MGQVCSRLYSSELRASRVFMFGCGNVCNQTDRTEKEFVEVRSKQKATKGKIRVKSTKNWKM